VNERPVRVAFVSDSVPERNGVGAYYADLIDQFTAPGRSGRFEIRFICPGGDHPGGLRFPLPGDTTQRIHLPSTRRFGKLFRELDPDVVVVATPGPFGMLGVRWARKLGARLLVGYHTDYAGVTDLYKTRLLRVASRRYFDALDRSMCRRADQVLVNNASLFEHARALGARDVRRIGTLLPRALLETPVRPHSGRLDRVLFAGRLAPEKRLAEVLAAAEVLGDVEFVVAGDGPLKDQVRAAAARLDNLNYVGWLNRTALMDRLDEADALVLPSEFETFGNIALEAMARARIAAVTSTCGIAEWKRLARHMVIFEPARALSDVLVELRRRPEAELRELATGAREAAVALNRESLAEWIELLEGDDQ